MSFEEIAIVSVNCVSYRINFYASKDKPVARLKKYIMTKGHKAIFRLKYRKMMLNIKFS